MTLGQNIVQVTLGQIKTGTYDFRAKHCTGTYDFRAKHRIGDFRAKH